MKQTPIPEKIKQYDICHEKDVLGIGYVYELDKDKILNLFNSLIDVLTEHEKHMTKQFAENRAVYERMNKMQKEIEELKKAYTHHIKAEHIGYDPKPYTAMRSTGCKNPIYRTDQWGAQHVICGCHKKIKSKEDCGCSCHHEGKERCFTCSYNHIKPPIPSDEEMERKLEKMLFYSKGWNGTYVEAHDLVDRILAIVKGE